MNHPLTLAAIALFAVTAARADYAFTESFDETHPFNADGEITFSNTHGSVVIRTWDRNEVRIAGEKAAKTEEELALIDVDIRATSSELAIKSKLPRRASGWFGSDSVRGRVMFTLTVPATARLRDIGTTNGAISIEGVRGSVKAHSINGEVTAHGLAADASFSTVNGTIDAAFDTVARDQKISTRTVNGTATIALPADADLRFEAHCVNGSVACDFPHELGGRVKRNKLSGTIGDGSASLAAKTVNGRIHLKRL